MTETKLLHENHAITLNQLFAPFSMLVRIEKPGSRSQPPKALLPPRGWVARTDVANGFRNPLK